MFFCWTSDTGISDRFIPGQIVIGRTITFDKYCKHECGDYVQTHESPDNGMGARTISAIEVIPKGGNMFIVYKLDNSLNVVPVHPSQLPNSASIASIP